MKWLKVSILYDWNLILFDEHHINKKLFQF